jgi:hypothetical protein
MSRARAGGRSMSAISATRAIPARSGRPLDGSDATITDGRLVVGSGAKTAWQTRCPVNPKGLREVRRALPRI